MLMRFRFFLLQLALAAPQEPSARELELIEQIAAKIEGGAMD